MEEQLISFETAKLAKEKGFDEVCSYLYENSKDIVYTTHKNSELNKHFDWYSAPTQSLLQKFIREKRGVHIEIHRNASGYYWSMCKEDGGTDLGWSDMSGPNYGGVWDSFEDALENALQVQLSYDLPNDTTIIKHWGNYVEFALKSK
ncbi:MAG TPA: hypothetical protein GX708_23280 [Gallicola sp.]|nr:hypothetical protein [Gallicola sp.]